MAKLGNVKNLTNAGKGRPKGSKNKSTLELKDAVLSVYDKLGGDKGLLDWAESSADNKKIFYSTMVTRLLPKYSDIQLSGNVTHNIADRLLESRNRAAELRVITPKPADPKYLEISSETHGRLIESSVTVSKDYNDTITSIDAIVDNEE